MSNFDLALKLFLQMAVILGVCRLISLIGRRFLGQTEVVCEMIAGVLLGPSLFGLLAPAAKDWLFPSAKLALDSGATIPNPSMSIIFAISQIGIVVYMFLIGLEFNTELIRGRMRSAGRYWILLPRDAAARRIRLSDADRRSGDRGSRPG